MDMQYHLKSDRDMKMSTYEDTEALTFVDVRRRGARTGKERGRRGREGEGWQGDSGTAGAASAPICQLGRLCEELRAIFSLDGGMILYVTTSDFPRLWPDHFLKCLLWECPRLGGERFRLDLFHLILEAKRN